jgi:hypothetical protein
MKHGYDSEDTLVQQPSRSPKDFAVEILQQFGRLLLANFQI